MHEDEVVILNSELATHSFVSDMENCFVFALSFFFINIFRQSFLKKKKKKSFPFIYCPDNSAVKGLIRYYINDEMIK